MMTTYKINVLITYIFVIFFLFFLSTGFSQDIPSQISYQGKLSENSRPVNGEKKLNFSFFSESTELWSETHENVQVYNGLYHVILGSIQPIPLTVFDNNSNVQLQIMVDDVVLLPNVNILSVGYAFVAQKALVADRLSDDILFINETMNVGIGINDPKQKLDVSGGIHFGYTENDVPGSIRTDENDIEFYNGEDWLSLLPDSKINMVQIIAGEDINGTNTPVAICMSKDDVILSQTIKTASANAYGMTKIGTTFTIDSATTEIKGISLFLEKNNAPPGIIDFSVYLFDNSTPGQYPVKNIQLETSQINNGWNVFQFSSPLEVVASQQYAIILYVPGGDFENYMKWYYADSNPYTEGLFLTQSKFNAPWLTNESKDLMFQLFSDNRGYRCENLKDRSSEFIGFLSTHESTGNKMNIQTGGIVKGYTSLHKGMGYYFQEDGTISTSPGTGPYAGIAMSDSELLMKTDVMWVKDSKGIHNAHEGNVGIGVKDAQAKLQITNLDDSQDAFVVQQKVEGAKLFRMQLVEGTKNYIIGSFEKIKNGFLIGGIENNNIFLIKTDDLGNYMWTKQLKSNDISFHTLKSIQIAKDGSGIILCGQIDYEYNESYGGRYGVYLIKTDQSCKSISWIKTINSSENYSPQKLLQTLNGGLVIVNAYDRDICIIKLDSFGKFEWVKNFGGYETDNPRAAILTDEDSILVHASSSSNFQNRTGELLLKIDQLGKLERVILLPKALNYNCLMQINEGYLLLGGQGCANLMLIDNELKIKWCKQFYKIENSFSLDVDEKNELTILGQTYNYGAGKRDIIIFHLNKQMEIQWARTIGGTEDDTPFHFIRNTNGFILIGRSYSFSEKDNLLIINTDINAKISDCETCQFVSLPSSNTYTPQTLYLNISDLNRNPPGISLNTFSAQIFSYESKVRNIWDGIENVLTVTKSGKVGIGTETPTHDLQVNGTISSIASYETSDMRFKKDFSPIENALQSIDQFTGYRFYYRTDEFPEKNFPKQRQIGFGAQELANVYPELVYTDDEGILYVDYDKMSAVSIECIKELKTMVEKQQQTIEKLQQTIENQQKQIHDMNERFNSN
jgi:hypothetical protein